MTEKVFAQTGRNALTLTRGEDLTLVLTVVKEGTVIKEHQAPGPATIILLSGSIAFSTDDGGEKILLESGSAVAFAADVTHSVKANKDSAFLIVIGGKM
jgi:quercetin dioxygenase-like cupin family protein